MARIGTLDELTGHNVEVEVRAASLTAELRTGLERWGQIVWADGDRLALAVENEEALPAIAGWLVDGGARLYSLSPRRLTLEELFVQIVEEAD